MGAKTCLLCGKPLGLIRVGSGGDFCSREHRNQYQLRRSMDCLTEANKVATLARRRENPKALFAAAVLSSASAGSRSFLEPAPFTRVAAANPEFRRAAPALVGNVRLPFPGVIEPPRDGFALFGERRQFGMKLAALGPVLFPASPHLAWKPANLRPVQTQGLRLLEGAADAGKAVRVPSAAPLRPRPEAIAAPGSGARRIAGSAAPAAPAQPVAVAKPSHIQGGGGHRLAVVARAPARPRQHGMRRGRLRPSPGMRDRSGSPPFALPPLLRSQGPAGRADARLAFTEMGFSAAPDSPARVDWIKTGPGLVPGKEHRRI